MGFVWVSFGFMFGFGLGFRWVCVFRWAPPLYSVRSVLVCDSDLSITSSLTPPVRRLFKELRENAINSVLLVLGASTDQSIYLLQVGRKRGFVDVIDVDQAPIDAMLK